MVSLSFAKLSALLLLAAASAAEAKKRQLSVIQLISDGYGPASATMARSLWQYEHGLPWDAQLPLDKRQVGTIRTRSTDSLVTDSAASASAYSCGLKSVNAYIGVDSDKKPCGTTLEAAKIQKGYNTALVTTSRVTHATPASWSAHVPDRDMEAEIASQQLGNYNLGRQVDLLWGGGFGFFLPNTTTGSSRKDSRDLIAEAQGKGWQVVRTRADFDALKEGRDVKFPSLALFTRSHMAYEIDRDPKKEPSLTEMAIAALNALKKAGKPFFIMIEGARIDHAAHNNDPAGHVRDIFAYQEMVEAVAAWVDKNDRGHDEPEMIVISTSDHECGGITLASQRPEDKEALYGWYPDVVARVKHSTEYLSADFLKQTANSTDADKRTYMSDTIIRQGLAIDDANDDEIQRALDLAKVKDSGLALTIWLASMINWRSHLSFSTTGHSGTDVNLYYHEANKRAYSQGRKQRLQSIVGSHENTWIGTYTAKLLGLDLGKVTNSLNNGSYSWNTAHGNDIANFTRELPKYHGGVKRIVAPLPPQTAARRDIGYSYLDNVDLLRDFDGRSHRQARRQHSSEL